MTPTDEQIEILSAARDTKSNMMVRALAGTGKTTTLEMIDRAIGVQPHLYLVFNKRNAEEAKGRLPSTTAIKTLNSLGHGIWAQACSKNLKLDPKKSLTLFRELVDEAPKANRDLLWSCWEIVRHGVDLARALGYVPDGTYPNAKRLIDRKAFHALLDETPDDLEAGLIDALLTRSIRAAYDGFIDFNDQIYMPGLFGGSFPRFPLVLVDEYQDLSPVNHAMLEKLCKFRHIGVGDDNQSIYAFRGADTGGMSRAVTKFGMTTHELSISFRCPSEIVRNAHWHVPQFKWFTEGGEVHASAEIHGSDIDPNGTIICRNNAPLMAFAFQLLAIGRSVNVSGSDIGPRLINTLRKLGPDSLTQTQALNAIEDWLDVRLAKESKSARDLAECMRVFVRHGSTLGTAISYTEHLFKQSGTVQLLTGHKSKGLEFDTVYHLDSHLCRQDRQDQNLRYVIDTRAKRSLTYINSNEVKWD